MSLYFQHLELSSPTVTAVIVTEGVGREECRCEAYAALPSGQAMWMAEDPDPGCHETNIGRVTLSVIHSSVPSWPCDFSKTQHLRKLSLL